ncbi:carbohydrate-binding module family 1 protein [Periconia macrospinosa]|uniref:AA9 family lytic polysaccharide monooxygenase n=1 Tax=Periconia macrospinosa TaxID=97972 RepID=A0A2V1D630_9PLEO|nr:carbohydrate-binding module family 1 protein [Periconia macrospinosa]
MKASFAAIAVVAQVASAHYSFDTVVGNGRSYQYVRDLTRPTKYNPIKYSTNPTADIRDNSFVDKGTDIVCNQGAFSAAGKTEVLEVKAGDKVTLKVAVGAKMEHPGPSLVYMSKAPSSVKTYDGSGEWFKIFEDAVCSTSGDFTKGAWCSYGKDSIGATIPKDTPDGEYLFRVEHIGVHRSHVNQPEHYVGCAQIKVTGGGSGTPGPTVKFPGAYKSTDDYANFSIYNGFKAFKIPGPAVWTGGSSGGGAAVADEETTPAPAAPSASAPAASAPAASAPAASAAPPAAAPAAPSQAPDAGCAALYGQCGGKNFKGAVCCSAGACKAFNPYYSQCL